MATINGNQKKLTVSGEAIEGAVNSKHEHINKTVLDKLSDNNGNLQYNGSDITGGGSSYTLPTASETTLGGVKVDGTTITVNDDGIISATATGTGLTEEQATNVAKIPTIETKVNTNTNSISNLETRVTQVESNGISDEVINQKISEYISTNGVLSDSCIKPNNIDKHLVNGLNFTLSGFAKGVSTKMLVLPETLTGSNTLKIKGKFTAPTDTGATFYIKTDQTSTPASEKISVSASGEYDIDLTFNLTNTTNHITITTSATSYCNGSYSDMIITVNDKIIIPTLFEATAGTITDDTIEIGSTLATTEYTDSKVQSVVEDYVNRDAELKAYVDNMSTLNRKYRIKNDVAPSDATTVVLFDNLSIPVTANGQFQINAKVRTTRLTNTFALSLGSTNNMSGLSIDVRNNYNRYSETVYAQNITPKGNTRVTSVKLSYRGTFDVELYDFFIVSNGVRYEITDLNPECTLISDITDVQANKELVTQDYLHNNFNKPYKKDFTLPFPNTLYVVDSENNRNCVPIFIDYLYGYWDMPNEERILFSSGDDRVYMEAQEDLTKMKVKTETLSFTSEALNVADVNFKKVSIPESQENGDLRVLIIGDSVTAGAITQQQYWSYAAELFAKEDLIHNRNSKVKFLGTNKFSGREVTYNSKTKTFEAGACGVSSWALSNWLGSDNNGTVNGFTYTDGGEVKFSILKWIERYRNYDDNLNKLSIDDPSIGTMITSENIDKVVCCTPNVVYINSTHNGGTIEEHEKMIEIIRSEIPDCKIIIGSPMPLCGSWWYKEKYLNKDWLSRGLSLPNYGGQSTYISARLKYLNNWTAKEKQNSDKWFYFMPQCVTMPSIESFEYDTVMCGTKEMKRVTSQALPREHPGTHTHQIWGYELYCLLKYIAANMQGITVSNEVTVTLDNATANLNVGGTTTITGTPSDSNSAVTYTSSDTSIATVDSTGLITAIAAGTCYVYAETETSIRPAVCTVTVTE